MKYEWYKKGNELLSEIEGTDLPDSLAAVWYIGQMGLIIRWNGLTICFDPVLNDLTYPGGMTRRNYAPPFEPSCLKNVDYVICSHNHADHINLKTLFFLWESNPDVRIIVPQPECGSLTEGGIPDENVCGALEGQQILLRNGAVLHPVAAAHEEYITDELGNQRNLGYVLQMGDQTLYHAGDTLVTPKLIRDLKPFYPVDIACVPINGVDVKRHEQGIIGNMDCRDAAWFTGQIGAGLTIPLHYDMVMGNEENSLIFAYYMNEFYPGRRYHIMQLGERLICGR